MRLVFDLPATTTQAGERPTVNPLDTVLLLLAAMAAAVAAQPIAAFFI